ncbi:hypothetical protein [Methanolobus sp. WCC5]|uniref:hypothetical protein n=1 Tax=Methanolobus sp. WCC5 TaxID=3125785 RepID=UPI0032431903
MHEKRYPKGYFISHGMVVGLPLGIPIGIVLDMIAIGPLIGLAFGAGIGTYLEKKKNPNPLQLAPEDEIQRKRIILALSGFFLLGILAFIALLMMTDGM